MTPRVAGLPSSNMSARAQPQQKSATSSIGQSTLTIRMDQTPALQRLPRPKAVKRSSAHF